MMYFENMVWEVWFAWIVAVLILGYVLWLLINSNKKNSRDKMETNKIPQNRISENEELKEFEKMSNPELNEFLRIRIDKDIK